MGVYRDERGRTPVLDSVKKAEQRLLAAQVSKTYLGSGGAPEFNDAMRTLMFGSGAGADRIVTLQTPGGSGSLRVAAGLILRARPGATVWASDPTWANHVPLLGGAGVTLESYPYYDGVAGRYASRRCWTPWLRYRPATSSCCTAVATTRRAWISMRSNGARSPT